MVWVNLENHPFVLRARWIQEFSGRLFVEMDYIAPDERGRVSLQDHLVTSGVSLSTDQALHWAISSAMPWNMPTLTAFGVTET